MNAATIPIVAAVIGAAGTIIAALIQARQRSSPPVSPEQRTAHGGSAAITERPLGWLARPLPWIVIFAALFLGSLTYLFSEGRVSNRGSSSAQITITHLPAPGTPGTGSRGEIDGTVSGSYPSGAWVLVYACVNPGDCYIQPLDTNYKIYPLNGKWSTTTHLGDRYVALIVAPGFANPPPETPNPPGGEGVLASDEKRSTDQQ
jgi:hypothetical protein